MEKKQILRAVYWIRHTYSSKNQVNIEYSIVGIEYTPPNETHKVNMGYRYSRKRVYAYRGKY
jgi:hypothetical protein